MVIAAIEPADLLTSLRSGLVLPLPEDPTVDIPLIAALARRAAGILCPCSRATLATTVSDSLKFLVDDPALLGEQIDAVIEGLLVGGDLLELNQVAYDDPATKSTWVFAAPPSFVDRKNGSLFLLGIPPDEQIPLPQQLRERVVYDRCHRIIRYDVGETLGQTLRELGLNELSERVWLRCPREETAQGILESFRARLAAQGPSGSIEELQLLNPELPADYYRGRWVQAKSQTGTFVARRPHAYGAPIWGFVTIENGAATRFLDFPFGGYLRWRGCDVAWHLQMAIDGCRGQPQQYRRRDVEHGAVLDFFSPLPSWAERRLAVVGHPVERDNSLLSYFIPNDQLAAEERFIQERLWLTKRL
jgi:hypothetical protein